MDISLVGVALLIAGYVLEKVMDFSLKRISKMKKAGVVPSKSDMERERNDRFFKRLGFATSLVGIVLLVWHIVQN